MTVNSTVIRSSLACNGATKIFPVPIQAYQASDFDVFLTSAAGVETPLVLGGDYTMVPSSSDTPPKWTLTTLAALAYAAGNTLQVILAPVQTQTEIFLSNQAFPSAAVEQSVDRLTQMVLRLQDQVNRCIRAPDGDIGPSMLLSSAALRANLGLIMDPLGNIAYGAIPTVAFTQAIFNAFYAGVQLYPQTPAEVTAGVVPTNYSKAPGNALRYGADPTGAADSTVALQNAINCAFLGKIECYIPGGIYLVSGTLTINAGSQIPAASEYRGDGFTIRGDGSGPAFDTADTRTTVLTSATDTPILRYNQYLGAVTSSGNYYVRGIRFIQTNAVAAQPVVQLDVLGEYSVFERFDIFQAGTGDGLRLLQGTKGTVQFGNILNRDWNTAGLGAARVGCGLNVFDQYNAGLLTIRKITSRGFKDAFIIGYGNFDLGPVEISKCEASVFYRGMTIGALISKAHLSANYFEGGELTCIVDKGRYTSIHNNELQPSTWTTGIDGSAQGGGASYKDNQIGMSPALSGVVGIKINGAANATLATVADNYILWGSNGTGLNNVFGLQMTGVDAMINHHGNMFNPNSGWHGTCQAINDLTTSSSGSAGSGVRGLGVGEDGLASAFPRMARGALGLYKPAALGNAAMVGTVLQLGEASDYELQPTANIASVTSINPALCEEGHIYVLHILPSAFTVTFTAGANMKLAGAANVVTGANGNVLLFRMKNNVAWQLAAVGY